jgi:single-strand DNA-binding protein
MSNTNKIFTIGRVTKDIELKTSINGKSYVNFTVAVNRRYKNDKGEREADFLFFSAFGKLAEILSQYAKKGMLVAIEGTVRTGSYEKDGVREYTTQLIAESVDFLSSKVLYSQSENNSSSSDEQDSEDIFSGATPVRIFDEDLPF